MAALASCGAAAASQASAQTCVGPSSAAQPATAAQHVWAYDFVFDACANNCRIRQEIRGNPEGIEIMMKIARIALISLLIPTSIVAAKECSSETSCEFRIDDQWNLIHTSDGKKISLAGKEVMQDTYVMLRGGEYYLVKESDFADKSFVIVPIIKSKNGASFDRVIYFSIEAQESSKRGYAVWSGDEISLSEPRELSKFSWSAVSQWHNNFKPARSPDPKSKIQEGFRLAELTIHNLDGREIGNRTYIYPNKLGATPESLVCYKSCVPKLPGSTMEFRGGIGSCPIEMSITESGTSIRGTYRYQNKGGDLNLIGNNTEGKISLNEYIEASQKRITGKFSATRQGNQLDGVWIAQPQGRQLHFFVVPDGI